ncbi:hypothetical protein AB5I41_26310 [Sphingomonas sp. MMS24-JH45]
MAPGATWSTTGYFHHNDGAGVVAGRWGSRSRPRSPISTPITPACRRTAASAPTTRRQPSLLVHRADRGAGGGIGRGDRGGGGRESGLITRTTNIASTASARSRRSTSSWARTGSSSAAGTSARRHRRNGAAGTRST